MIRSACQCDIPELEDGVVYIHVSAGEYHTVLLRSDGRAVACGANHRGQHNIPELKDGMMYLGNTLEMRLLQLFCKDAGDGRVCFTCVALNGETTCSLLLPETASIVSAQGKVAQKMTIAQPCLTLVLPTGNVLHSLPSSTPV